MTESPEQPVEVVDHPFSCVHVDHGLEWKRVAKREWARLEGYSLVVFPKLYSAGYHFAVLDDETQEPVVQGEAETRPEARMLSVRSLGHLIASATVEKPELPEPAVLVEQRQRRPFSPLMNAAISILFAVCVGVLVASIALAIKALL